MGMYYFFSKNGKLQKRGKINLIGRLQLSTEKSREEENEGIIQLRILRVQVTISNTLCNCDVPLCSAHIEHRTILALLYFALLDVIVPSCILRTTIA